MWRVVQDTIEHFQATIPSEGYEREYALDAVFRYYKDNGYITPPMKIDGPDYFENGFVVSTVFFHQERCPKCLHTTVRQKSKNSPAEVIFQVVVHHRPIQVGLN